MWGGRERKKERKKEKKKERENFLEEKSHSFLRLSFSFVTSEGEKKRYTRFFSRLNRKSLVRCVSRLVCELHENSRSCYLCGSNFFSLSLSRLSLSLSLASLSRARVSFNVENTIYPLPPEREKNWGKKKKRACTTDRILFANVESPRDPIPFEERSRKPASPHRQPG